MQVQERKGFPSILFGSNQEKDKKSITLKPGHEYIIELDPYGQMSTDDFKTMSLEQRQCRLYKEVLDDFTHPIYTSTNCRYDCYVKMAFDNCKCIPWDFVNKINGAEECDIFGRTCFFNMIETLTHGSGHNCQHCIEECDWVRYRKVVVEAEKLEWERINIRRSNNKYISVNPTVK